MSFQGLTPEALVQRSDSKDPATTCKGLTASGRPCRRTLGATPGSSPLPSPSASPNKGSDAAGVLAVLNEGDAAAFFCWQHKDQAENLVARLKQQKNQTRILPLQKRSSIDTLAERVGVLDLDAKTEYAGHRKNGRPQPAKTRKRDTLPSEWQRIDGPLMSVPEDVLHDTVDLATKRPRVPTTNHGRYGRSNVKASWACCIRADDDYNDDGPPVRRRERPESQRQSHHTRMQPNQPGSYGSKPTTNSRIQPQPQMQERPRPQTHSSRISQQHTPTRPSTRPSVSPPHTQTKSFLSIIPPHLNPNTTSSLLAELSKPFAKDDDAGYIYIFWLTPVSEESKPDDDLASTILDGDLDYQDLLDPSPSPSRQPLDPYGSNQTARHNRTEQIKRYASVKSRPTSPPKILLKIGRAQNVHRRLSQWTKQCNQNITLVRYYPYHASAAADPRSPGGAKVPHVNRVERLIHLELRGMGWGKEKELCAECGREHREWFEVPATKEGLKGVDGVVKRWVDWAETSEGVEG